MGDPEITAERRTFRSVQQEHRARPRVLPPRVLSLHLTYRVLM